MGGVVVRFGVPRSLKAGERHISLNVKEPVPDKSGYPVWLNEVVDGQKLLGHRLTMFVQGKAKGRQWFELSGPIRLLASDGSYIMEPRVNANGTYLNDKGEEVSDLSRAAMQYSYVKSRDGQVVMGKFGTINVQNTRADGAPSLFTYLTIKLYSDTEVLQIAREQYAYSHAATLEDKEILQESLRVMKRTFGKKQNLFINDGAEYLRSMGAGFDVRVPDRTNAYVNAP